MGPQDETTSPRHSRAEPEGRGGGVQTHVAATRRGRGSTWCPFDCRVGADVSCCSWGVTHAVTWMDPGGWEDGGLVEGCACWTSSIVHARRPEYGAPDPRSD